MPSKERVETEVDARSMPPSGAFSTFRYCESHAATGAPDIRFDLGEWVNRPAATGCGEAATEIVVEIEGESDGRTKRDRCWSLGAWHSSHSQV